MKKLLLILSLAFSFSVNADGHLDFELSDFCYQQFNVQERSGTSQSYTSNWYHVKHDGTYYFPNEEEGITSTSLCVFKNRYGQFDSKGDLKDGKKNGKWIHWYSNGQKWVEASWKNGKKDGLWSVWTQNGIKEYEEIWKNNKEDGRWTWWNSEGEIELKGTWKDGKPSGEWLWYRYGSIDQIGTFDSEGLITMCKGTDGENKTHVIVVNGIESELLRTYDCEIFTSWRNNFNRN